MEPVYNDTKRVDESCHYIQVATLQEVILRVIGDPARDISSDVKRFLDSRSVEERNQIYKYLQDTDRTSKEGEDKESGEDSKSRQKKSSG